MSTPLLGAGTSLSAKTAGKLGSISELLLFSKCNRLSLDSRRRRVARRVPSADGSGTRSTEILCKMLLSLRRSDSLLEFSKPSLVVFAPIRNKMHTNSLGVGSELEDKVPPCPHFPSFPAEGHVN